MAPDPPETITGYGRLYPSGSNELLAEVTYIIHRNRALGGSSEDWWGVLRPLRAYPGYEIVLHEDAELRLEFETGKAGEIAATSFPPEPSAEGPVFFQGRGPFP